MQLVFLFYAFVPLIYLLTDYICVCVCVLNAIKFLQLFCFIFLY